MVLIGVMLFIEINTFLMMNTMGIPHNSIFNKLRLALFGFLSMPAAAEWYLYVESTAAGKLARIGPACWLCFCVAILEVRVASVGVWVARGAKRRRLQQARREKRCENCAYSVRRLASSSPLRLSLTLRSSQNCLFWKFFPSHFVTTIDKVKISNWTGIPMPMDILVKHLTAGALFFVWFVLRYKIMPRNELLADVDKKDKEVVNRCDESSAKSQRRSYS